ncbi:MAG: SH3 domain-containing protein [Treponema sp.]|jgi:hypothetical protein|nr:SH3 domain-containing protein [Treponema sp.]
MKNKNVFSISLFIIFIILISCQSKFKNNNNDDIVVNNDIIVIEDKPVYSQPNLKSSVIGKIKLFSEILEKEIVRTMEDENIHYWYKFKYNNSIGYVWVEYVYSPIYLFMTHEEAGRHYFNTGQRDRYFAMEAHFIENCYEFRGPELFLFTNDPTRWYFLQIRYSLNIPGLPIDCSSNIPDLPKGTVIKVYYQMNPAPGGNTDTFIDFIEPLNKHFIIDHTYSTFENLNIRDEPSISSSKITTLNVYDTVQIIEEGPEETIDGINSLWVKVRLKSGQIGWAFGGYLEYWNRPPVNYNELDNYD